MPVIYNPLTGVRIRVPYGDERPSGDGDINDQGGVGDNPYGPNPAPPVTPMAPRVRRDPDTGERIGVEYPVETAVVDPVTEEVKITTRYEFVPDRRPAGRAGRDPAAVALDQAQIDRIRQQIELEPEKLALEAELGRGRLGLSREELALTREFGMIDRELKRLEFEWKQATDARDYARKVIIEDRMQAINERKAAVEERLAAVQEANQRVNNLDINLKRNEAMGYVVDAEGTGVEAGVLTAKERQRRFDNLRSVAQAVQAAEERQLDRRREDARYIGQREDNAIQRDLQQMQLAEQARQFDVQNQQMVASRRRPAVFTPGLAMVSRAGGY